MSRKFDPTNIVVVLQQLINLIHFILSRNVYYRGKRERLIRLLNEKPTC